MSSFVLTKGTEFEKSYVDVLDYKFGMTFFISHEILFNITMKKILLFLSVFVFVPLMAQQGLLDQANDSYKQEKYAEAVALYDSIIATGYTSAEVYYNLGNAHYKMGHVAPCILNYERALQIDPNDKDIAYNLELVQQHVVDEIEMVDVFFLKKILHNLRASQSSDTWARISIMAFVFTMVMLLIFLLSRVPVLKKVGFYFTILAFVVALTSLIFSSKGKKEMTSHDTAIVFSPTVTVKSSPNDSGTKIFVLHEGTKVQIVDRLGEWVEIMLSDGNKGWMKAETIEEI